jgi:GT2 family glycosyltransferase
LSFSLRNFILFLGLIIPRHKMAAAAGGCILIRRDILEEIGGIDVVKQALD